LIGSQRHQRAATLCVRSTPRVVLLLGKLTQPLGYLTRRVELTDLDQRLDQLGRNRERPWIEHPLTLAALPHHPQVLDRPLGRLLQQRRHRPRAQRLELVPASSDGLCALERVGRPPPRLLGIATAGREQRPAALVLRTELRLGRPVSTLTHASSYRTKRSTRTSVAS
jgi:hypothetical protein